MMPEEIELNEQEEAALDAVWDEMENDGDDKKEEKTEEEQDDA